MEELTETMVEVLEDNAETPEAATAKNQQNAILAHCLKELSPAHREVIDLVYYHEKSVREVSEIIGIPQATVKTRMHYARLEIAELLNKCRGGTSDAACAIRTPAKSVRAYGSGRACAL